MKLLKIISGGQTGADQGGLRAAVHCKIPTGGWLPKGCITLVGPRPDLLELYGMTEHSGGYAARTEANVKDSGGTVRFAKDFKSPGERCTLRAIKWFGRPYFDVKMNEMTESTELMMQWLLKNDIKVLNVAGNTEETAPGIEDFVFSYLVKIFENNI